MTTVQAEKTEQARKADRKAGALAIIGKQDEGAEASAGGERDEIRRQVLALRDKSDQDAWAMAAALVVVHEKGYYNGWGFSSWRSYVEDEVDIHIRKAQQLIKTEQWLALLPKNVTGWIRALGWTKARMLCNIVTAENAAEWRAKLEGKSVMAIDALLHEDAQAAAEDPNGKGADTGSERQKPYTLGRPTPAQRANMDLAAATAAKAAGCDTSKDRLAYIWDLIATEYQATNGGIQYVQQYLANVEAVIGLRLIAYDLDNDEVVYGGETLDVIGRAEDPEDEAEDDAEDDAGEEDADESTTTH